MSANNSEGASLKRLMADRNREKTRLRNTHALGRKGHLGTVEAVSISIFPLTGKLGRGMLETNSGVICSGILRQGL
jgi:hypothetical protein